jgi:hypothetical protein
MGSTAKFRREGGFRARRAAPSTSAILPTRWTKPKPDPPRVYVLVGVVGAGDASGCRRRFHRRGEEVATGGTDALLGGRRRCGSRRSSCAGRALGSATAAGGQRSHRDDGSDAEARGGASAEST